MKPKSEINFSKIEKKWQKIWDDSGAFAAKDFSNRKKFYVLEMFPYPSSSGLHMGHALNYTIGDIFARFKRMQGFNVLHPMGFDSFGLPAENAAIKAKSHPKKFTEEAIKNYISQMKKLGLSYDWGREIEAHKPDYYRWDQWIFLKMFERGLVYKKKSPVNWCPECKTVLANEQVQGGKCWRHDRTDVETKYLEQWYLKITDYAEELYDGIDKLENWPEVIKTLQRNWIGKKKWIDIEYPIAGTNEKVVVSTTRPDTNFGATFVVIAPEHELLSKEKGLVPSKNRKEVDAYILSARKKTKEERVEDGRKKTGVFTGLYCVNPLTKKKMPLWVADFVLTDVGTGVVVGVPGHDKRDFEFAEEFGLEVVRVVVGKDGDTSEIKSIEQVQEEEGKMINSGFLDGLDIHEATKKMMEYFESRGIGKVTYRYRLKDWGISRQRYWGTPIPIVHCEKCGAVPVGEKDLPVKLPETVKFGEGNPLETNEEWIRTKCPKCSGNARRETDTMDTFVNSSWYFLRYCDAKNEKKIFDPKKANYWCPIDLYIGGKEHACLHLIYIRFYTKFLRDMGLVSFDEPSDRLFNQGFLLGPDGEKMSKSKGNVILPETVSEKYGIDTARLFLVSIASPDKDIEWSDNGVEGSLKIVKKIFDYVKNFKNGKTSERVQHKLNKTIKFMTENIESVRYNFALIQFRDLFESFEEEIDKKDLEKFLKLFAPFCPHIAEELWSYIGDEGLISLESWPKVDESKIQERFDLGDKAVETAVSDVQNILRIVNERGGSAEKVYLYVIPKEVEFYDSVRLSSRIGKEVVVFSVNDKNKPDPQGKASKAKPGKPAIFVE